MRRQFKTGDTLWSQIFKEQQGEDKDIEHHRGLVELMKNHRDAYLNSAGHLKGERSIWFAVKGSTITSWNQGYPWVNINDFEIVGRDSKAEKGSRYDCEESVSGKEVGRLQIFRLARRLSSGVRDFELKFHCKNVDGKEASVRVFNWNENDGSYEVELLDEVVEGTIWTIRCERNIDIVEMHEYLEDQLKFFDTDIIYNFNGTTSEHRAMSRGEKASRISHRKKLALPHDLGVAYINTYGDGHFTVYNLGIKLRTPLDVGVAGISGVIITEKFVPEDLGRGSLIQSDEHVSDIMHAVRHYGIEHLTIKIKQKSGDNLTEGEREFLLKKARNDSELRGQIETRMILPRGNDSYTSISRIVQAHNEEKTIFWSTGNAVTDDKAIQRGFTVVERSSALEEILGKYGVEVEELGDVEEVKQWENGYKLLDADPETLAFFDILKEWLIIGMRSGIESQATPELRPGRVSDESGITGWTDSQAYIAFRKDVLAEDMRRYLKKDTDLQRLEFLLESKVMDILTHEIAHWAVGEDSIKISTHGDRFQDALTRVRYAVFSEMNLRIKELLRAQEPKLSEWTTKVKTKKGGDGKLLFAIAIPRDEAEKLKLTESSIVHVALTEAQDMPEDYSKRGYSAKNEEEDEGEGDDEDDL